MAGQNTTPSFERGASPSIKPGPSAYKPSRLTDQATALMSSKKFTNISSGPIHFLNVAKTALALDILGNPRIFRERYRKLHLPVVCERDK
jgi:hypothetical protein